MSAQSVLDYVVDRFDIAIEGWYEQQRNQDTDVVNRNVMCVGLIMCEHMRSHFPLSRSKWFTGTQVSLLGGSRIRKILAQHGEFRPFASEGGRTSRGSQDLAGSFAAVVNNSSAAQKFKSLADPQWAAVIDSLHQKMVKRIRDDFFNKQRLALDFDSTMHTRHMIESLLSKAKEKGGNSAGAVAQHLVGAKLQMRHPELDIEKQSYTTADQQTGRAGDFMINDTAIHVTISPTEALANKCQDNINHDYRPMIITQADRTSAARVLAGNLNIEKRVYVRSIEEFVAGNVEEMAVYSKTKMRSVLKRLLEVYNKRVGEVESDPSVQVDIPDNLG